MSSPRFHMSLALLLATLLAGSTSTTSALLVCVSADGFASLEFAVPGTTHCDDHHCEPEMSEAEGHSCRDITVLATAPDAAGTATPLLTPPTVAAGLWQPPRPSGREAGAATTRHAHRPPPPLLRSVILVC